MFDLAKAIKQEPLNQPLVPHGPASCTLFYQAAECVELVEEVFRFEGWQSPKTYKGLAKNESAELGDLVLLDLTVSVDVVADAREFAGQIPTHKGLIVIGCEDAISTLRSLKAMGFYYVFWPVNKQELTDFIQHVNNNLKSFSGVSKQRKAKSVAIVGTKGGVGTSLIAAELASVLSGRGADTILVDHQYSHSNIDILLGLKQFQRRKLSEIGVPIHEMDNESAANMLTPVSKNLRLLALEGAEDDNYVFSFNQTLCDLLSRNANFIIDDHSRSTGFELDLASLVERQDSLLLVIEPSIASVRTARYYIEQIESLQQRELQQTRVLTVLNLHRPEPSFALTQAEVTEFLQQPVDAVIPYVSTLARQLVAGRRSYQQDKQLKQVYNALARLINGESTTQTRSLWRLLGWLKR